MFRRTVLAFALLTSFGAAAATAPLTLEVYNPGATSMFPVSSEIVSGAHDAVLIDARFQRNDAQALVDKIRASGKTLTTVYISHSDPDYYFGLDVIHAAFPTTRIVATAPTVAAMKVLMQRKPAYWSRSSRTTSRTRWCCRRCSRATTSRWKATACRSKAWTAPPPRAATYGFRR